LAQAWAAELKGESRLGEGCDIEGGPFGAEGELLHDAGQHWNGTTWPKLPVLLVESETRKHNLTGQGRTVSSAREKKKSSDYRIPCCDGDPVPGGFVSERLSFEAPAAPVRSFRDKGEV